MEFLSAVQRLREGARRLRRRRREGLSDDYPGSRDYWERRYRNGGHSGAGSEGELAAFKANVINGFIDENSVRSVIELGCGDGRQLSPGDYETYIGLDVSRTAVERCREKFRDDPTKSFFLYDPHYFVHSRSAFRAELGLSLDVIYHLTEDDVFELHMRHLFEAAERFVIIYSSNSDRNHLNQAQHVRHRFFSVWVEENIGDWWLQETVGNRYPHKCVDGLENGSFADFYIYRREGTR